MKLLVMNVNHVCGVSKKTGKPFDFATLTAFKSKSETSEELKGLKPLEFFCESSIFATVPQLPAICDVEYDLEPGFNGQARMSVTAVKLIKPLELQF